ncbi:SufE family protein [Rhabdochlamydiaceae symbiont of Dictyostelium giganteum]|uniref:SufE family protein n=1 Tax=Rhabdochlamydiaceae symbiont of Dictyostelium giganteum TaxID=3342349 RepID=UPI003850E07C
MTYSSIAEKGNQLKEEFALLSSPEKKYEKIITMGKQLPRFPSEAKIEKNLVLGCQSLLYLETSYENGVMYFQADSEALISKGLAAILITVYSGATPESIIKELPLFLKEMGLHQALSPTRSNGLASLFKKMQLEAFEILKGQF